MVRLQKGRPEPGPAGWFGACAGFAGTMNRALALVAGGVIVVMACLIVVNVTLRFLTNAAILGVEEIIQVAMVPVIFLAIGYCGQIGGHISVDLLERFGSRRFWAIVNPTIRIAGAAVFAALSWQAARSGQMAAEFNEVTNIRRIPFAPMWYLLSAGAAFAGLIELAKLFWITQSDEQ